MEIKHKLIELGLKPENSVIIGSGILNALNLRESNDIDVVLTEEKYKELAGTGRFEKELNHNREILSDVVFQIGTDWTVTGRTWKYDDLIEHSTIIDGVRYNSIEFLLEAKRGWIAQGEGRPKDIKDITLMEQYLTAHQISPDKNK